MKNSIFEGTMNLIFKWVIAILILTFGAGFFLYTLKLFLGWLIFG